MSRYVISGGREGYERLRLLARVRWPETALLFADVGVGPGQTCLDLGCGGGAVTLELARLVAPSGSAVGIDMDAVKLELARTDAAEAGLSNAEFRRADVGEWSDPEAYDVVYSRFLLEHVPRPLDLLRRMWAAVRPGGALAVEDADFDGLFSDPPHEAFELWKRLNPEVLEHNGGDPRMGRKLHRLFLEAGAPTPEVRLTQNVSMTGEAKMLPAVTLAAMSESILSAGLASQDELNGAIEGLEAFAADPTTLVAGPRVFQVWARKPGEGVSA
jgi:ubiquinone/menaquinone biosynthesis C-methylase UbiE